MPSDRDFVAQLLAERKQYANEGRADLVNEVDEELRRVGASAEPVVKRAEKRVLR